MPASNRPAVLPDGSYASQTALADTFAGAGALGASAAPNLRTLLLAGDFFLGAVVAGTGVCQRHQTTSCKTCGPCLGATVAEISNTCRFAQHLPAQSPTLALGMHALPILVSSAAEDVPVSAELNKAATEAMTALRRLLNKIRLLCRRTYEAAAVTAPAAGRGGAGGGGQAAVTAVPLLGE